MSKYSKLLIFVFMVFFLSAYKIYAQGAAAKGNIIVMTRYELAFPDNWNGAELDSLTNEYCKYCLANNEYVVSYKSFRHWWGHNNRDFYVMMELKTWDDILKESEKESELFRKHWATQEQRDQFNNAFGRYFTTQHSDEIYRDTRIE